MKKIISGLAIATATLLTLGFLSSNWAEDTEAKKIIWIGSVEAKDVELEIVLIVNKDGRATGLRYIFTNNSKFILQVWPPNMGSSWLVTRTPNGKIDDYVLDQEKIDISRLPIVQPGTSKHWDEHWGEPMNMLDSLQARKNLLERVGEKDNPYRDEKTGELMTGDYELFWRIERHIPTEEALRSWWLYCQRAFSLGKRIDKKDFRDWRSDIPGQDLYGGKDANLSSNAIIFTVPEEDIEDAEDPK